MIFCDSFVAQGVWIAYQGLWAGEWLREAAGRSEGVAAAVLTGLALSLVIDLMDEVSAAVAQRLALSWLVALQLAALVWMWRGGRKLLRDRVSSSAKAADDKGADGVSRETSADNELPRSY